jgi:uncharacterized protein (DUF1015 family)
MRRQRALEAGIEVTGEEPFNFFMSLIYPDDNLLVMEYNRLVKEIPEGMTNDMFLKAVQESFDMREIDQTKIEFDENEKKPTKKGQFSLLMDKKWYMLDVKADKLDKTNVVTQLDS